MSDSSIDSVLKEERIFAPPAEFSESIGGAYVGSIQEYLRLYDHSINDPEGFWAEIAGELDWFRPWEKVLEWEPPDAKWFVGATTNICHNCVDRQVAQGHGDSIAIIWEGEPVGPSGPEIRRLTYTDLKEEVCRLANVLKGLGVRKGDVVTLYMGMVPELAIAMLACARIGAPHSVIFAGFSAKAIADRVEDAGSRIIVTADGGWRRGKVVELKANVDAAAQMTDLLETVVVLKRCGNDIPWTEGRDHWWHDLVADASTECPCEPMDSEDMLFLLYTSGSTGKPKGIVHTTGGYMVFTYLTSKYVFNLVPEKDQVYWCTADIGWVTGHSYVIYGILSNGVTSVMYEGAPNHPDVDRFWEIVDKYNVTILYTAPTAIRTFMKWGDKHVRKHSLASLRLLGTVGEPINPEAWIWYHRTLGKKRCPIVDTWWQTETGGILITPLPGCVTTTPGSATLPFPGIFADILDEQGKPVGTNQGGYLVITRPWPGMLRGIYGDRKRYKEQYWSKYKGIYLTGDGARKDKNGYFWIMGRVDDVMNVAGHRLSTMEIESALVSHPEVVEAAVVGRPDEIKGTAIVGFVTLEQGNEPSDALRQTLRQHVAKEIGAIARPDEIRFTESLPKTRSGKIMRRLLRDIAAGRGSVGDTTTLEDYSILAKLREAEEA